MAVALQLDPSIFQIGLTKVFFKKGALMANEAVWCVLDCQAKT